MMMPEITDIFSNSRSERHFDPKKDYSLSLVEKIVTEAGKTLRRAQEHKRKS